MSQIRPLKNAKKDFDRSVDRSVELRLGLCYQQKSYPRVGRGLRVQAEGCKVGFADLDPSFAARTAVLSG